MIYIVKRKINMTDELRSKIKWACTFNNCVPMIKNGSLKIIEHTNLAYVEPHRVIIKEKLFLFFNNGELLKEWIEFREETAFCEMTPQDKKYCIYFHEIAEKILKNVPDKNKKYIKKQLEQLDKNFMDYLYYWNEKYYRNGFADIIELLEV